MRCLHKATRVKQRRRRRRHKVTLPRWAVRRGRRMRDRSCTTRDGWAKGCERGCVNRFDSCFVWFSQVIWFGPLEEGSFMNQDQALPAIRGGTILPGTSCYHTLSRNLCSALTSPWVRISVWQPGARPSLVVRLSVVLVWVRSRRGGATESRRRGWVVLEWGYNLRGTSPLHPMTKERRPRCWKERERKEL